MDELLSNVVPQEDLERFEKKYHHELELDGEVTTETKFEYAFCLVRSRYTNDVRKGIMLLEELARTHAEGRRDYIYYLAFGNARIKEYTSGLKYCRAFLDIESNDQVRSLQDYINKQIDKEVAKGMAVAGGAALVLGGILGLGIALARNKQKREK
ncbi:mitochondrial fission 1 protein isoform X45 [Drosophila biarmipes]|uniref:mitochondrial fission 1 protein isoform X1 n=1 Tax=Drosophila biarmipes TaxID=125945 RepID=UPI0007E62493|nr:mitochondrial fission 1 protein isoform X1 [Drosophila biarmipes]XP_043947473.1 mitochondrial fission 1 protein isoform X2 [Drosophila biarmipes]XP_050745572.1 mitochondrial fission 1 protein isoform X3 [Drosophila biarmipes]XP_050745573.1 mitochondrial fission 1 protein isoform X4 [Drosophila biarmipes]XP_050745574.1 mitochondrial fission 1 protein isoform X5 [Drosophila biarmipes]XP_050745575.1 mitochondrial fission 1 protein isoform X6 [Drosophila biarmipes]XP_050745576.1 mitochondrial 